MRQGDASLTIDGFSGKLELLEISGSEAVHQTWRMEVHCACAARPENLAKLWELIGANVSLVLPQGKSHQARTLKGILDQIRYVDQLYVCVLAPELQLHEDERDYRVFLDADALSMAKEFFESAEYQVKADIKRVPEARPQRVQFREGGLPFITRLLAEEGILWFFDPADSKTILLTDQSAAFPQHEPKYPLTLNDNLAAEASNTEMIAVADAKVRDRIRPQRVTLTDWNYKTPEAEILASKGVEGQDHIGERHHHAVYGEQAKGNELAAAYLQAHQRDSKVLTANTTATDLAPGLVIEVHSGERINSSIPGKWLVTSVVHQGQLGAGKWDYTTRIVAVPAAQGYRPAVPAVKRAWGLQTMAVTGPSAEEIHVDEDGRAMVKQRWDREHEENESASAWHRVVQPPMPGGMLLPRVGFEALTAFRGHVGDEPFLLGRLDNGAAMPNESLPAKRVASSFGSRSTPGGKGSSGLSTDDTKGQEGMTITAQYNYDEASGNDKKATVIGTDKLEVGTDRITTIGQGQIEDIGAAQKLTVGAKRKVSVESNINIQAGDEIVAIGGARVFNIGGDQGTECSIHVRAVGGVKVEACVESESRKVIGAMGLRIGGSVIQKVGLSYGLNVAGSSVEKVAGAKCIDAKDVGIAVIGAVNENVRGNVSHKAAEGIASKYGGDLTATVSGAIQGKGTNVIFKAKKITIKAKGVTVTLSGGKITIDGKAEFKADAVQGANVKI